MDAVDELPGVAGYLVHQQGRRITVKMRLREQRKLGVLRRELLDQLDTILPGVDHGTIAVEALAGEEPKTVAGKTRFIVRE